MPQHFGMVAGVTLHAGIGACSRNVARRFAVRLLLPMVCSGCTHVAPYERGMLAHRTMTADLDGPAQGHVHAVHEGAMGGEDVAKSGCGCN
jgi:hypothetical protein